MTITGNTATGSTSSGNVGGGVNNFFSVPAPGLNVRNSIIASNFNADAPDVVGSITNLGNNLIGGNAMLGPLADNGGPTQTHALLAGSPAIDAGDNADPLTRDQRFLGRPADGDGDSVAVADIGAFEFAAVAAPVVLDANTTQAALDQLQFVGGDLVLDASSRPDIDAFFVEPADSAAAVESLFFSTRRPIEVAGVSGSS